jgi:uncharacterized transporter YbjL
LAEFQIPASWCGKKLSGLNEPEHFWLTAVTRFGSAEIVGTNAVGQEGDVLHFVADASSLDTLRARLEHGPEA